MPSVVRVVVAALLLAPVACEPTPTEPEVPVDLVLDFCANEIPVWFAYRNTGGDWTVLAPDADGTFRFTATNDVALAFVRQNAGDVTTEIVYAANWELERISGLACLEESGTKTVYGTIAGAPSGTLAHVTMNFSSTPSLDWTQPSFALSQLATRPLDLVATRTTTFQSSELADRVIIRRSQTYVSGGTMPTLDFTGNEAFDPASFAVTTSGVLSGDFGYIENRFFSQLETSHPLSYVSNIANGNVGLRAVPASQLATGDYHDLYGIAITADGSTRGMEVWFLAPANRALFLGPPLVTPSVTAVSTTPYLRLRAQLARQLDYDRALVVTWLQQSQLTARRVAITVTAGYDESGQWDATIPDLAAVPGWQNDWGLAGASMPEWSIFAYGGRADLLFGARPVDFEFLRFAGRLGPAQVGQMLASDRPTASRISRRGR